MFSLEVKTALLMSAGIGIGRATAIMFANAGARAIATDRDIEVLRL